MGSSPAEWSAVATASFDFRPAEDSRAEARASEDSLAEARASTQAFLQCPAGHNLVGRRVPCFVFCDSCGSGIDEGRHAMDCRRCDWIMCDTCRWKRQPAPMPRESAFRQASEQLLTTLRGFWIPHAPPTVARSIAGAPVKAWHGHAPQAQTLVRKQSNRTPRNDAGAAPAGRIESDRLWQHQGLPPPPPGEDPKLYGRLRPDRHNLQSNPKQDSMNRARSMPPPRSYIEYRNLGVRMDDNAAHLAQSDFQIQVKKSPRILQPLTSEAWMSKAVQTRPVQLPQASRAQEDSRRASSPKPPSPPPLLLSALQPSVLVATLTPRPVPFDPCAISHYVQPVRWTVQAKLPPLEDRGAPEVAEKYGACKYVRGYRV